MATTVKTTYQNLYIDEVSDVVISSIEVDAQNGGYVRKISIFGSAGIAPNAPVMEIRINSDTADDLEVTTPNLNF